MEINASVQSGPKFILASLLAGYPDEKFPEYIQTLSEDPAVKGTLQEVLSARLDSQAEMDDLRSEYIDIFDRGRSVNSLYETEYGRERAMVKGNQLVDIAGFYRAFGFETGGDGVRAEMIDHIAVQLEFYALMLLKSSILEESGDKEGQEIVLDARKKFLKDHLGRFVGAICDRPGVVASPTYSRIFQFCRDLVARECESLGVVPERETWIQEKVESDHEALQCGALGSCAPKPN